MGKVIKFTLSSALSFTMALAPALASAGATKKFDPVLNQYLTDRVLDETFAVIAKIKTQNDAKEALAKHYTQKDLKNFQTRIQKIQKFPKIQRLNRGFAYEYDGKKYEFVIEDIGAMRFRVNRKFNWTYDRTAPLTAQLEYLNRSLQNEKAAFPNPFFDEAYADGGTTILIGILIAGVVVPVLSDLTNTYVLPTVKSWYCKDKDPNEFATFKYCEEYFKHQAATRPKVPAAKPVTENHQPEIFQMEKKCSKVNDPDFWVQFEGESGVTLRRTIKYDESKKPKEMIEEQIRPPGTSPKTFTLKGDGELLKVTDGNGLFLSRDKDDAEQMNSEKFERMKAYDKALETTIGFIKTCDESVATDISLKAAQPGYATAGRARARGTGAPTSMATVPSSDTTK